MCIHCWRIHIQAQGKSRLTIEEQLEVEMAFSLQSDLNLYTCTEDNSLFRAVESAKSE
jgi:2-keto-4-pentenoate hydratase